MKFSKLAVAGLPLLSIATALVIPHDDQLSVFTKIRESLNALHEFADSKQKASLAPLVVSETAARNLIEDSYLIVFKTDVDHSTAASHHSWVKDMHDLNMNLLKKRDSQHPFLAEGVFHGLKDVFNIGEVFRGYSGKFHPDTIEVIRRHPDVAFVERDSRVFASDLAIQDNASWGLARISHRPSLSLGSFNKYLYDDEAGEGVTAYVIDTGINIKHTDLEDRASWGATIPQDATDDDLNGHGSHCSGTIAGKKYGVAKNANVVAVKALGDNGSGSMSDIIKAVEFVVQSHMKDASTKKGYKGATANLSLGGGKSNAVDYAMNAAVRAGLYIAVAAGNENADACNTSPAGAELVVTVGATALSDERAYFSNFGKCVDIFAPGVNIQSIYMGSPYATGTLSGTSMASPHICGLLTYFLSLQPSTDSEFAVNGAVTPAQLKKNLVSFGTKDIITDLDEESPNVLAYNGGGANLTEFWAVSHEQKLAGDQVKIMPIQVLVEEELEAVAHEVESFFEELKEELGFAH